MILPISVSDMFITKIITKIPKLNTTIVFISDYRRIMLIRRL
ncbi:MAG: hypothetical protein BWZ00_01852 [Bacteroidetes bacterium ADurb.BinA174]|nr:MAG: hypothetical protein BWZ00_01852 [Bacteroidetes bacterium ADurb.BinA174]